MKMTEDEVVLSLIGHLRINGWAIDSHCLGHSHGIDIQASKKGITLLVEAKGAKANSASPIKKREQFDSGQIKTHFGKAIVKILHEKHRNPNAVLAIAHPDDKDIKKAIGHLISFISSMGIKHYWVSMNGTVTEE